MHRGEQTGVPLRNYLQFTDLPLPHAFSEGQKLKLFCCCGERPGLGWE